jgi:hypothetical protein
MGKISKPIISLLGIKGVLTRMGKWQEYHPTITLYLISEMMVREKGSGDDRDQIRLQHPHLGGITSLSQRNNGGDREGE